MRFKHIVAALAVVACLSSSSAVAGGDCGNGVQELGEDCDGPDLGTECVACESDCTCSPRICEFPGFDCPLGNGANGPFVSAGGWWVYDSNTPAFAVNTCGTEGVDTFLTMWSLSGLGLGFENADDDCDNGPKTYGFEADSDPLAPCFNRAGPVCVCTGGLCVNEGQKCNNGDVDCLTINLCFGGGNEGGVCNIANGDDDCTDFCVGGLNDGSDCSADPPICETLTCVSGPFTGAACTVAGTATADCSGLVCTGSNTPGQTCVDDSNCGGEAGACQQRDGDCAVAGFCSASGSCQPDAFCAGDIDAPFESCLCEDYSYYWAAYYYYYNNYDTSFFYTTQGTTWLVSLDYFGALPIGSTVVINVEKRSECGDDTVIIIGGLDIRPESCPNSVKPDSHGFLPVAVVGTQDFDVSQVDLASLRLTRADGAGGSVAPNDGPPGPRTTVEDAATPFEGELCDCHELGGDGIDDLLLKFRHSDLVAELELDSSVELVELTLSGTLLDGTDFRMGDCIRLVQRANDPRTP